MKEATVSRAQQREDEWAEAWEDGRMARMEAKLDAIRDALLELLERVKREGAS